jgi:hypothetical protein
MVEAVVVPEQTLEPIFQHFYLQVQYLLRDIPESQSLRIPELVLLDWDAVWFCQLVAVLVVLASAVAMVVVVVVADKVAVELASVVVPAVGMVFVERLDLPLMSEVYIADVEEYLAEP